MAGDLERRPTAWEFVFDALLLLFVFVALVAAIHYRLHSGG